ncbi:MAG: acyltransferase family protein [Janthinobacterium lividum]
MRRSVQVPRAVPELEQRRVGAAKVGKHLAGVDGLRAAAALSILVVHVWTEGSPGGTVSFGTRLDHRLLDLSYGVTLFFTLSGFLLYRPFCRAVLAERSGLAVVDYLRKRALRIIPAYWTVLLICALLVGGLLHNTGRETVEGRLTNPTLLVRVALLVQNYDPRTILSGIGPAWTLAVEVVFYLVLPLLAWVSWRWSRGRSDFARGVAAWAPPAFMLVLGLAGKAVTGLAVPTDRIGQGWNTDWHSVLERSFFCQADLFSFGMGLAVLHCRQREAKVRLPRCWNLVAGTGAVVGYLVCAKGAPVASQLSYSAYNTVMALACASLLAVVVLAQPGRSRLVKVLELRPVAYLGAISYSVFLWHHPLVLSARRHHLTFDGRLGVFANLGIVLVATLVLSTLTYRYVEAPMLRLKSRQTGPPGSRPRGLRLAQAPTTGLAGRQGDDH